MTDREPDDLYDALRDRLADYGQEPPVPLWTSIRAQLPPPVAAPQLRRRWSSVLLLSLLLAVVGAAGWQWWRMKGVNQRTSRDLAIVSAVNTLSDADQMGKPNHTPTNQKHPSKTNHQPIITNPSAAKTTTNTGITSNEAAGVKSAFKHLAVATDSPKQPKINRTYPAVSETDVVFDATTATSGRKRQLTSPLASRDFAAHHFLVPSHGKFTLRTLPDATDQTSTARNGAIAALVAVSRASDARHANHLASQETLAATLVSPASASSPTTTFADSDSDSRFRKNESESYTSARAAKEASPKSIVIAAEIDSYPAAETPKSAANMDLTTRPALRIVALELPALAAPIVQATTDTVLPRPQPLVRRWEVLVLGGPALTHRQLGGDKTLASPFPANSPMVGTAYTQAGEMAQQERASTGFGLQVQLRWLLNGRWSLSTGLGYQQYASQTAISGAYAIRYSPAPPADYTHRDTYQFLTVPLRLGYALGPTASRLHCGLLAGADVAFYLGGSTLSMNGAVTNWDHRFSPYHALSVALSTGLDVRYRLAPHLELAAQPMVTHFLTSVTKPAMDQDARYLWGIGAWFGVSFDLR